MNLEVGHSHIDDLCLLFLWLVDDVEHLLEVNPCLLSVVDASLVESQDHLFGFFVLRDFLLLLEVFFFTVFEDLSNRLSLERTELVIRFRLYSFFCRCLNENCSVFYG